jgi:two-component system sensor histidine kinase BaeS
VSRRSRHEGWGRETRWERRSHRHGPGLMHRRPYGRPGWWPASEPWPPQGPPTGRVRRLVMVRVAAAVAVFIAVAIVVPLTILWLALQMADVESPGRVLTGLVIAFVLLVMVAVAFGGARRIAVPLGNLIEAAGRVENGDYSVRVDERHRGPYELRALTRAFNEMAARLETDERQRRTLLADVGHELRTPLAVLQGQLEAMVDGVHPADEAHLAAALEEIKVMEQLVDDLRTLTLAEAGTLALHREPTDMAVLIQDAVAGFGGLARSVDVKLQVEMTDELPSLDLDPIRIRQVLGNLVSNALRYAPRHSTVRIVARHGGAPADRVAVSVVDSGPGIPPELLPHLFERFAKSAESRGSGLGLAIARRLVEAHGGSIRAEQPAGGGTAIVFELPVGPA